MKLNPESPLEKLQKLVEPGHSNWEEKARFRKENREAFNKAGEEALPILRFIRANKIEKESLAERSGLSDQTISNILKGNIDYSPEELATLKKSINFPEKKKRVPRKKTSENIEENTEKPGSQEKKVARQKKTQEVLENVTRKRKLKKSLEIASDIKTSDSEDEEAFRGEDTPTIFTAPVNLPFETESRQPDIDDMSFNHIVGKETYNPNPEPTEEEIVYEFPEEKISPEELYAPILPTDPALEGSDVDHSPKVEKPLRQLKGSTSFGIHKPKNILKRFYSWLSGKNPDMSEALDYYSYHSQEEKQKHSDSKQNNWFKKFQQDKQKKEIDPIAINDFVDRQHRTAVEQELSHEERLEKLLLDEALFDNAREDYADHLEEGEPELEVNPALLDAWAPYLKARAGGDAYSPEEQPPHHQSRYSENQTSQPSS